MRVLKSVLTITVALALTGPSAAVAQQRAVKHVVDTAALDRMVADRVRQQDADREVIREVLRRPDVREVAQRAGLDIVRAEAGVALLEGKDLQEAADQARQVQTDFAGGSSVTLQTTTIIIILLVVILIIVAVK